MANPVPAQATDVIMTDQEIQEYNERVELAKEARKKVAEVREHLVEALASNTSAAIDLGGGKKIVYKAAKKMPPWKTELMVEALKTAVFKRKLALSEDEVVQLVEEMEAYRESKATTSDSYAVKKEGTRKRRRVENDDDD